MKEGKPSQTALLIARTMVFLGLSPETAPLIAPESVEIYRRFLRTGFPAELRKAEQAAATPWMRRLSFRLERLSIPGIMLHYTVRKLFLEETARRALAEGVSQVVVLGAGLDPLALRLHREHPEVLFVEVDHPATQEIKRKALAEGEPAGPNLKLVELRIGTHGLEETLLGVPGYREDADTLLIAEGLMMYLEPRDVDAVFAFVRDHAGPGSRVAFTLLERLPDGRLDFPEGSPLVRLWLRRIGEPFTWGLHRREVAGFLAERGFELRELADDAVLRERYLAPRGLADRRLAKGELVAVAGRG
jgi:methyltransferase (TIGR00027 family)